MGYFRLQDCVAILEGIDEHSVLNMNKVIGKWSWVLGSGVPYQSMGGA